MIVFNGKEYRSKKHPILEYIFEKYNPNRNTENEVIPFTLRDIHDGYLDCEIPEPASISNTILDLVRQDRGIESRLPSSIRSLGYDLRKRTGPTGTGANYAGEFVFVGVGNSLQSWLVWPDIPDMDLVLSSSAIPEEVRPYLRKDEGALFSVIDYCDILSQALSNVDNEIVNVKRVQNPMKWQPNEIDGFYVCRTPSKNILFPIEAKALVTKDEINLEQLEGGLKTVMGKYSGEDVHIIPIAIQMIQNGMRIAVFEGYDSGDLDVAGITLAKTLKVQLDPAVASWD